VKYVGERLRSRRPPHASRTSSAKAQTLSVREGIGSFMCLQRRFASPEYLRLRQETIKTRANVLMVTELYGFPDYLES
jgi:hypothetical protein